MLFSSYYCAILVMLGVVVMLGSHVTHCLQMESYGTAFCFFSLFSYIFLVCVVVWRSDGVQTTRGHSSLREV